MAFAIDCLMDGYRVLGVKTGTSKKGNTYKALNVYKDGRTAEVSVTKPELFACVDALHEMDTIDLRVAAVAGKERSFISLSAPVDLVG